MADQSYDNAMADFEATFEQFWGPLEDNMEAHAVLSN